MANRTTKILPLIQIDFRIFFEKFRLLKFISQKIFTLFTYAHVNPNLNDILKSAEHKKRYFKEHC